MLVRKRDLVLLRLRRVSLRLFAAQLRGQVAVARGIIRGGGAIRGSFAQRVKGGIRCAHALLRDGRLLLRRVALAIQQALDRGHQQRAVLRVRLIFLRHHLILLRELLIAQIARGLLCSAGHRFPPSRYFQANYFQATYFQEC